MISSTAPTSSDCRWPPGSLSANCRTAQRTNGTRPSTPNTAASAMKITYGLYMM